MPCFRDRTIKMIRKTRAKWRDLCCIIASKDRIETAIGTIMLSEIDQKNGTDHIHIKMPKDGGRGQGYEIDAVNAIVQFAFVLGFCKHSFI